MQSRTEIVRARWQLWAATYAIIAALAGVVIVLATSADPIIDITFIPSRALLGIALGGMTVAFVMYAVDRERNLHRLADRLMREQIESERLSARLQYLAELSRERDTNAAILDGAADAIVVLDADGIIRRGNHAMAALAGVAPQDLIGASFTSALPLLDGDGVPVPESEHPVALVLGDGVARTGLQLQLVQPDGATRWVSATFSPIISDGDVVVALGILRDIEEQKEQEVMHRDFVSMAAHELRSPLTAIKGFTRTLITRGDEIADDRRLRYLSMVNEQSDRLARLVDDLMQVSRIDANRLMLEREDLDLQALVSGVIDRFRSKWSDRRIELTLGQPDLPPAEADPHKVEEILINLIDNAVKYSPAEAPVQISVAPSDDGIRVDVRDSGDGIEAEELGGLFTKFHRLPASKRSDIPGTGLGLYIVKGMVEAHGGRVWVESTVGEGTTFSFTLPAAVRRIQDLHAVGG